MSERRVSALSERLVREGAWARILGRDDPGCPRSTPRDFLLWVGGLDPHSSSKPWMWWLALRYADGVFSASDAEAVRADLALFAQASSRLPVGLRDIQSYPSPSHAALAARDAPAAPEPRAARRRNARDEAMRDCLVLLDTPALRLLVPLTRPAATFLGRGTRWCTSARQDNAFDLHASASPLVVGLLAGGRKFQFTARAGGERAVDESDAPIWLSPESRAAFAPVLVPLFLSLMEEDPGLALALLPEDIAEAEARRMGDEDMSRVLARHGDCIRLLPREVRADLGWALRALARSPSALLHLLSPLVQSELSPRAVLLRGFLSAASNMSVRPQRVVARDDVAEAALRGSPGMVNLLLDPLSLPSDEVNRRVHRLILERSIPGCIDALPPAELTREMCMASLGIRGGCWQAVPARWKSPSALALALSSAHARLDAPAPTWRATDVGAAVRDRPRAILCLPHERRSPLLWEAALSRDPFLVEELVDPPSWPRTAPEHARAVRERLARAATRSDPGVSYWLEDELLPPGTARADINPLVLSALEDPAFLSLVRALRGRPGFSWSPPGPALRGRAGERP